MILFSPAMFSLCLCLTVIVIVGIVCSLIADKLWGDDWHG